MDDETTRGTAPLRADAARAALLRPHGPLAHLEVLPRVGSTSTALLARLAADPAWADGGLVAAEHQDAGRGRGGHTWTTPPGSALTFSLAVRPGVPVDRWGWLPLLAGLAVVRAVRGTSALAAGLKWPNDVLVPAPEGADLPGWGAYRKAVGILAEVVPGAHGSQGSGGSAGAVVVGIGVNVAQDAADLPVPSATSLRAAGGRDTDRTDLLVAVVRELTGLLDRWRAHDGDAAAAGLDTDVAAVCLTLGTAVRATLPDGSELRGDAVRIAADGSLVVRDAAGAERVLLAGDVRHVRPVVN